MSNTFQFQRWLQLVQLHWADNRRRYLLALPVIAALLFFWYGFFTILNPRWGFNPDTQAATYYVGFFLVGGVYSCFYFSSLQRKSESIQFLLVPASHLEKILCGGLFTLVLFFIAYTVVFYCVDIPMAAIAKQVYLKQYGNPFLGKDEDGRIFNIFGREGNHSDIPFLFFFIFLNVQAAFILGSIYFTRYSAFKTILSAAVIVLLGILLLDKVSHAFLPTDWNIRSLTQWNYYGQGKRQWIKLPQSWADFNQYLLEFGLPLILWVVAVFRLKEKEV